MSELNEGMTMSPAADAAMDTAEEKLSPAFSSAAEAVGAMKAQETFTVPTVPVFVSPAAEAPAADTPATEAPAAEAPADDAKWKSALSSVKSDLEKELEKANDTIAALIESEKKSAVSELEEKMQAEIDALKKEKEDEIARLTEEKEAAIASLTEEKDAEIERLTKENETLSAGFDAKKEELQAEIEKGCAEKQEAEIAQVRSQYEQQIAGINNANHEKLQTMRKEMDGYKEQIEMLMLEIDDPFIMQKLQGGMQAASAEEAPAAEGTAAE